jgi:F420-dependent oxidoreductase-like protein
MVRFGVQLCQEEFDFIRLGKACREVEDMGFESAWLYDHFYPMSSQTSKYILEPWAVLPSLASETTRLRLGVLVTCNSYRFPSVLAKIAATVDIMSEGRLEFGIGAGWYKDEYLAYGIPFPDVKTRIEQLAESIEIIKRIWTSEKASFQGKYYAIKDLFSYPKPVQKPYPPIWIGGKNKRLLQITAQHADYANFASCSVSEYQQSLDALKRQCMKAGRNFKKIEKTWHGRVIIVDKEKKLKREAMKIKESSTNNEVRKLSLNEYLNKNIAGTPEQCVEKIQKYVDLGVTYFIPHFPFAKDLKALKVFIEKVVSAM